MFGFTVFPIIPTEPLPEENFYLNDTREFHSTSSAINQSVHPSCLLFAVLSSNTIRCNFIFPVANYSNFLFKQWRQKKKKKISQLFCCQVRRSVTPFHLFHGWNLCLFFMNLFLFSIEPDMKASKKAMMPPTPVPRKRGPSTSSTTSLTNSRETMVGHNHTNPLGPGESTLLIYLFRNLLRCLPQFKVNFPCLPSVKAHCLPIFPVAIFELKKKLEKQLKAPKWHLVVEASSSKRAALHQSVPARWTDTSEGRQPLHTPTASASCSPPCRPAAGSKASED